MFAPLPLAAAFLLTPAPPDAAPPDRVAGRSLDAWTADLLDPNRVVRTRAALSLRPFGAAGVPALTGALGHEDAAIRYLAAEGIGMRPDAPAAAETVPRLETMLNDGGPAERLAAAFALAKLGRTDDSVPVLAAGLTDPRQGVYLAAADFLARIGPPASAARDALAEAGNSQDYHLVYRSAQALAAVTGTDLPHGEPQK